MYCPFCNPAYRNQEIDNNLRECPDCHTRIRRFTIQKFLRKNAHLFTILGVLGTMLSLLPNLMDKLYSSPYSTPPLDWKEIMTVTQAYLLGFSIAFGSLFLFLIFLLIIGNLFNNNRNEEGILSSFLRQTIRTGDLYRIIFLCFFVPLIMVVFFFIGTILAIFTIFAAIILVIILEIFLSIILILCIPTNDIQKMAL